MRQLGMTVLAGVVLLGAGAACDAPRGSDDLFVTMQETTGDEIVFRLGTNVAAGCGERLNALIEPGCPRLSMAFDVRGADATNHLELYVQAPTDLSCAPTASCTTERCPRLSSMRATSKS